MATVDRISDLSEIRELLRALYAADAPVDIYILHENYRLSPGQLSRAVRTLTELGVAAENDQGMLSLTANGRNWVLMNRRSIFSAKPYWKVVPEEFLRSQSKVSSRKKKLKLRPSDLRTLRLIGPKG